MADNPVPRVKLPDFPNRKPVQPGPNSWKQDQQKKAAEALGAPESGTMRLVGDGPQVRDEINPTAPTFTPVLTLPKPRAYIQPATPLSPSGRTPRDIPTRAVTEPMGPRSFFRTRKGSIPGLLKKPNQQDEVIREESRLEAPLPPTPMPYPSSKAAQVSGYSPANTDGKTMPASAPPSNSTPEPLRASNLGSGPSTLQNRQQPAPIPETPSRRWLIENGYSTSPTAPLVPTSPALSQQTHASALGGEHNQPKIEGMIVGDGKLSPTKQGSYGRVANVEIVEGPGRVASVRGVVEDPEQDRREGGSSEQRNPSGSSQYSQQLGAVREHGQYSQAPHSANKTLVNSAGLQSSNQSDTLMTLPPTVYSPNNYAGVWENNPRVVCCILSSRLLEAQLTASRDTLCLTSVHHHHHASGTIQRCRSAIILSTRRLRSLSCSVAPQMRSHLTPSTMALTLRSTPLALGFRTFKAHATTHSQLLRILACRLLCPHRFLLVVTTMFHHLRSIRNFSPVWRHRRRHSRTSR